MNDDQKWLEYLSKNTAPQDIEDTAVAEALIIKKALKKRSLELNFEVSKDHYEKIYAKAEKESLFRHSFLFKDKLKEIYIFLSKPISVTATTLATLVLFASNIYQYTSSELIDSDTVRSAPARTIVRKDPLPRDLVSKIEGSLLDNGTPFILIAHSKSKYEFQLNLDKNVKEILTRLKIETLGTGKISIIIINN